MEKLVSKEIENRLYEIYENLRQSERFDKYYSEHLKDYLYIKDSEYIEEQATTDAEGDIAEEAIEQIVQEIKDELTAAWFYF